MKLLSIDPSISEIGICELKDGEYVNSYTFKTLSEDALEDRLDKIALHFREIKDGFDYVLIEQPDVFMRVGSFSVLNVKSIQMLMMAIGVIYGSLVIKHKVVFVTVKDWKGNSGKKVIQMIASRKSGRKLNTHEADAFMMAMNWERYIKIGGVR